MGVQSTKLAVNYSSAAAHLLRNGQIRIDCFKCPAWPDLVASVRHQLPVYVHFPLSVGRGIGDAIDTETRQPADWEKVERLLAQTGTPEVNAHLAPATDDFPDMPVETTNHGHIERLAECMIEDVCAIVERFGPERVVVENDHASRGRILRPAFLPEVIRRVVEEAGCGLLLDLSHVRLAAHNLDMDVREYISGLPVAHTREIHISGVQRFDGQWAERARRAGIQAEIIEQFAGRLVDHLPIADEDWGFYAWSLEQVSRGAWGRPWVVTLEYGGVGELWEMATDSTELAKQVLQLYGLVKNVA
jgi:uncharacterized protein (UPF0276 family)